MVALVEDEHLGLVGEPPERRRMDDAVAVAAEIAAAWRSGTRGSAGRGFAPDRTHRALAGTLESP